ncbi:MAG: hypothetical protein NUW01_16745, partial [Gemmatimonadaceae bacterium]|nr:hypothetical protein [Gemmatimonadaceae bacterium]
IVEREWPNGAPITAPAIRKAYRLALDVKWLARRVLSPQALAEYEKVEGQAWAEYQKATATARAEYEKATAPALASLLRAALKGDDR